VPRARSAWLPRRTQSAEREKVKIESVMTHHFDKRNMYNMYMYMFKRSTEAGRCV